MCPFKLDILIHSQWTQGSPKCTKAIYSSHHHSCPLTPSIDRLITRTHPLLSSRIRGTDARNMNHIPESVLQPVMCQNRQVELKITPKSAPQLSKPTNLSNKQHHHKTSKRKLTLTSNEPPPRSSHFHPVTAPASFAAPLISCSVCVELRPARWILSKKGFVQYSQR